MVWLHETYITHGSLILFVESIHARVNSTTTPSRSSTPSTITLPSREESRVQTPHGNVADRTESEPSCIRNAEAPGANKSTAPTGRQVPGQQSWLSKPPFWVGRPYTEKEDEDVVYWKELTWKEKLDFRKYFLGEYFRETRKCLPLARRLFMMIVRISPWRAVALLTVSILRSLIPALSLQTRGSFLIMVTGKFGANFANDSCRMAWKRSN